MGTVSAKDISARALRKAEKLPTLREAKLASTETPCSAIDRLGKETLCSLAAKKKKKKTASELGEGQDIKDGNPGESEDVGDQSLSKLRRSNVELVQVAEAPSHTPSLPKDNNQVESPGSPQSKLGMFDTSRAENTISTAIKKENQRAKKAAARFVSGVEDSIHTHLGGTQLVAQNVHSALEKETRDVNRAAAEERSVEDMSRGRQTNMLAALGGEAKQHHRAAIRWSKVESQALHSMRSQNRIMGQW